MNAINGLEMFLFPAAGTLAWVFVLLVTSRTRQLIDMQSIRNIILATAGLTVTLSIMLMTSVKLTPATVWEAFFAAPDYYDGLLLLLFRSGIIITVLGLIASIPVGIYVQRWINNYKRVNRPAKYRQPLRSR